MQTAHGCLNAVTHVHDPDVGGVPGKRTA
jgi:hypothetical protein